MRRRDDALGNLARLADIDQDHVLHGKEEIEVSFKSLCNHQPFPPSIAQGGQEMRQSSRQKGLCIPGPSCG